MDQGTRNQDGNITIFARMERVLEIGENKWKSTREWKRSLKEGCTSSQKNYDNNKDRKQSHVF